MATQLADIPDGTEVDARITEAIDAITFPYIPMGTMLISTNTTLSSDHNGKWLYVTSSCAITIPSTIEEDFECTIMKFSATTSVTVTVVGSGTTIYSTNGSGSVTMTDIYGVLSVKRINATSYHVGGDLA